VQTATFSHSKKSLTVTFFHCKKLPGIYSLFKQQKISKIYSLFKQQKILQHLHGAAEKLVHALKENFAWPPNKKFEQQGDQANFLF
jgi:hypothetical protein